MRVYLAGPINACTDDQVTNWRDYMKSHIVARVEEIIEWVDPADRDFRGVEDETFVSIVEGDKDEIDTCDVVVAYCWQPSYGTAMEILYAFEQGKRVMAVVPEDQSVSPWVRYHAVVLRNLSDVFDELIESTLVGE